MKTKMKHIYLGSLLALSPLVLSNCAHEPVTRTNAANASAIKIAAAGTEGSMPNATPTNAIAGRRYSG